MRGESTRGVARYSPRTDICCNRFIDPNFGGEPLLALGFLILSCPIDDPDSGNIGYCACAGKRAELFSEICVPWTVETVVHDHSQSSKSKSLSLEGMSDEVCILKRSAKLMSSIRVALMEKCSACAHPCPGPVGGQNFFNKAVETDP